MDHPLVNWFAVVVRLASWIACLIVVVAFLMFATNQAGSATTHQVSSVSVTAAPTTTSKPNSVRQTITNVSNTLTSPFQNVLGSNSTWVLHTSQLVLALLLYGFGVSFAMRWLLLRRG